MCNAMISIKKNIFHFHFLSVLALISISEKVTLLLRTIISPRPSSHIELLSQLIMMRFGEKLVNLWGALFCQPKSFPFLIPTNTKNTRNIDWAVGLGQISQCAVFLLGLNLQWSAPFFRCVLANQPLCAKVGLVFVSSNQDGGGRPNMQWNCQHLLPMKWSTLDHKEASSQHRNWFYHSD